MKSKLMQERGAKIYALIFDSGDEVMENLTAFAKSHGLTASQFTAIGAFSEVELAYFDWEKKDYEKIPMREQVEVLSLMGDVCLADGEPKIHAHVVVGRRDGTTRGGHLMSGRVRPTLELLLTESPRHLRRKHDPDSGLALIDVAE